MQLWQKGYDLNAEIEKYTVGNDYQLDIQLVKYDCLGSMAHARMLESIGVLNKDELSQLLTGLQQIIDLSEKGEFEIKRSDEDCHTAIENYLTKAYGDVGKKIHTARSRNDQVLTAVRLFEKDKMLEMKQLLQELIGSLKVVQDKFGDIALPGYTHMQRAMPTTVNEWIGCFVDAANDDIKLVESGYELVDQSPLGTAAGYGVPVLPIDREMTAKDMNFSKVLENPIYAQLSRGKFEANILSVCSNIMLDLNKLASDLILYNMTEFSFVILPDDLCTGSSIMPQKKNPDVLELVRGKYHFVLGEEFKMKSLVSNLISGYNRDIQLSKDSLINTLDVTMSSLRIMSLVLKGMDIDKEKCEAALGRELYATEEAYKLVKEGMPFRDAYRQVAKDFSS